VPLGNLKALRPAFRVPVQLHLNKLEVVGKPNLTSPSGFEEPPAEYAENAVAFSTRPWGWVGVNALIPTF